MRRCIRPRPSVVKQGIVLICGQNPSNFAAIGVTHRWDDEQQSMAIDLGIPFRRCGGLRPDLHWDSGACFVRPRIPVRPDCVRGYCESARNRVVRYLLQDTWIKAIEELLLVERPDDAEVH